MLAVIAVGTGLLVRELTGSTSSTDFSAPAVPTVPLPNPCGLLSDAVVSGAFQAKIAYASPEPSQHQCTWAGYPFANQYGQKKIVVSLAYAAQAEFDQSASYSLVPGPTDGSLVRLPSQPISHLGQSAYWFSNFQELAVYDHGVVIYLDTVLLDRPLASEEALARTIIARLDKLSAVRRST